MNELKTQAAFERDRVPIAAPEQIPNMSMSSSSRGPKKPTRTEATTAPMVAPKIPRSAPDN